MRPLCSVLDPSQWNPPSWDTNPALSHTHQHTTPHHTNTHTLTHTHNHKGWREVSRMECGVTRWSRMRGVSGESDEGATSRGSVMYCAVLCCIVLYCTILWCTILCCAVLCRTVLSCTVLRYRLPCYAVSCCMSPRGLRCSRCNSQYPLFDIPNNKLHFNPPSLQSAAPNSCKEEFSRLHYTARTCKRRPGVATRMFIFTMRSCSPSNSFLPPVTSPADSWCSLPTTLTTSNIWCIIS